MSVSILYMLPHGNTHTHTHTHLALKHGLTRQHAHQQPRRALWQPVPEHGARYTPVRPFCFCGNKCLNHCVVGGAGASPMGDEVGAPGSLQCVTYVPLRSSRCFLRAYIACSRRGRDRGIGAPPSILHRQLRSSWAGRLTTCMRSYRRGQTLQTPERLLELSKRLSKVADDFEVRRRETVFGTACPPYSQCLMMMCACV